MTKTVHYPVADDAVISQIFGVNRASYAPYGLLGHNGVDFAINTGSEIYAVMDGVVTGYAEKKTGYGRRLYIEHDNGTFTAVYGHLLEPKVSKGDTVSVGQVIALSDGALSDPFRGNSTGAHLHFEIRPSNVSFSNGYGGAVAPLKYLLDRYYSPPKWYGIINTVRGLNIRAQTNTGGKVLWRAVHGTRIEIAEMVGDWVRLHSLRPEYAFAQYIDIHELPNVPLPQPETKSLEVPLGETAFYDVFTRLTAVVQECERASSRARQELNAIKRRYNF